MKSPGQILSSFLKMVVVMLLPVLIPIWLIDRWITEGEAIDAVKLENRIECDLQTLSFQVSPREIFLKSFEKLYRQIASAGFSADAIRFSKAVIPGFLGSQVVAFSTSDEMIVPKWARLQARRVIRKLWTDLRSHVEDEKHLRLYRALFGQQFNVGDCVGDKDVLHEIGPGSTDGGLIWKAFGAKGGLLAFLPEFPGTFAVLPEIFRKTRWQGFYAAYDPSGKRFVKRGNPWPGWEKTLLRGSLLEGGSFLTDGRFCRIIRHPEGFWLMRSVSTRALAHPRARFLIWGFAFLFTLACAVGFGIFKEIPLNRFALGSRTGVMFVLGLIIPGVLLVNLGSASFRERALVMEQEVHTGNLEKLRGTDYQYMTRHERYLKLIRQLRDLKMVRYDRNERIRPVADELRRLHLLARIETRDNLGKELFSNDQKSPFNQMMGFFGQEVSRRYLGVTLPKTGGVMEGLATQILRSPRLGVAAIFDSPDEVFHLALGQKHSIMYWDAFQPAPGRKTAFFSLHQVVAWDLNWFFESDLASDVLAFEGKTGRWNPRKPPSKVLEAIAAQALTGQRASSVVFAHDGVRFLASAFPSTKIQGLCYLTWSSLEGVDKRVEVLRVRLLAGAVATLLLGLFFSQLLSGSLLTPIRHLARGIAALEARQLTMQVPELGQDELGALGQALNELMSEMRDVDYAREIQQSLIPSEMHQVPGYEVAVFSKTATDLGGDYCDILPMPYGRAVFLTADVTGHGISAALLTTMAKTICTLNAQENQSLLKLLERLNRLIHEAVKKRKLMTMVAGILDPKTHTFEWSCVGHTYPFMRKRDGTTTELAMPQYPLGTKAKPNFKTSMLEFEPGTGVFFYTDGLIEGLSRDNRMFGYDRMKKALSKTAGLSADESVKRIFDEFSRHSEGVPLSDDVTILFIQRINPE